MTKTLCLHSGITGDIILTDSTYLNYSLLGYLCSFLTAGLRSCIRTSESRMQMARTRRYSLCAAIQCRGIGNVGQKPLGGVVNDEVTGCICAAQITEAGPDKESGETANRQVDLREVRGKGRG